MPNKKLSFKPTPILKFKVSPVHYMATASSVAGASASAVSFSVLITLVITCITWITFNSYGELDEILSNLHIIHDVIINRNIEHYDGVNVNSLVEMLTHLNDLQIRISSIIEQLTSNINARGIGNVRGRIAVLSEIYRLIEEIIPKLEDTLDLIKNREE